MKAAQVEHTLEDQIARKPESSVAGPQLDRVGSRERR